MVSAPAASLSAPLAEPPLAEPLPLREQLHKLLVERVKQPWQPAVAPSSIADGGLGVFIEGCCTRGTVVAVYAGVAALPLNG